MEQIVYTVKKLADLAGISVRTLHYYDEIGLLKPQRYGKQGYRYYGEKELLLLQQILFFRELGFSLADISEIIRKPDFDVLQALEMHRTLLQKKIERLQGLVGTVDRTILHLKGEIKMRDEEFYGEFSREQQEKYEQEIREKCGSTALEESKRRMKGWSREDFNRVMEEGTKVFTAIRDNMARGYDSPEVQEQIAGLHRWLQHFYDCPYEMLLGLGHMYNEHPDFVKMWKTRYHKDMPEFLFKAIEHYCRGKTGKQVDVQA